jgi:hypothetical protein
VEALRKKEREDETQFTTKIGEKIVWVPVISFRKFSFPITRLVPVIQTFLTSYVGHQ